MSERENVPVYVLEVNDREDTSFKRLADRVLAAMAAIPPEYREQAMVDWSHDDYWASFTVTYYRPETDKEMDARIARRKQQQAERENAELREFQRLRAKYEGQQ